YNENGLSELLALYGSAYNVNIKIFKGMENSMDQFYTIFRFSVIPICFTIYTFIFKFLYELKWNTIELKSEK
ncbi:MAG: hypothetical protein ACFE8P_10150, partial [Promethearchaeota archaeon]